LVFPRCPQGFASLRWDTQSVGQRAGVGVTPVFTTSKRQVVCYYHRRTRRVYNGGFREEAEIMSAFLTQTDRNIRASCTAVAVLATIGAAASIHVRAQTPRNPSTNTSGSKMLLASVRWLGSKRQTNGRRRWRTIPASPSWRQQRSRY